MQGSAAPTIHTGVTRVEPVYSNMQPVQSDPLSVGKLRSALGGGGVLPTHFSDFFFCDINLHYGVGVPSAYQTDLWGEKKKKKKKGGVAVSPPGSATVFSCTWYHKFSDFTVQWWVWTVNDNSKCTLRKFCMRYISNKQFWFNISRVISKSVRRELTFLVECSYSFIIQYNFHTAKWFHLQSICKCRFFFFFGGDKG